MNHPTREEWMAYLYGEISDRAKPTLKTHLDACEECRADVTKWRQTMKSLATWQLSPAPQRHNFSPMVRWAAAAAAVLLAGFGFGRAMSPAPADAAAIRAAIEPSLKSSVESDLRPKLRREVEDRWQAAFATTRAEMAAAYKKQLQEELAKLADATLTAANTETERLISAFVKSENEQRTEENQTLLTLLKELETKRLTDYASLRKELEITVTKLETVAVLTEVGLRSAQQEIVQLASDRLPADIDK
jgi:putative zinc finger protein